MRAFEMCRELLEILTLASTLEAVTLEKAILAPRCSIKAFSLGFGIFTLETE